MFQGWLIKFGDVTLPNSFLDKGGWESSPNQRLEIDAYRDANALLHRDTSPNAKTSITLTLRGMTYEERQAFDTVIGLATLPNSDKIQRRVSITYWNDEELDYKTGVFYMADPKWAINIIDEIKKTYEYKPTTIKLTEY